MTNWLDKRRQKRREAEAYRAVPDGHDGTPQDKPSEIVSPVEMDTLVQEEASGWRSGRPLTLNEAGGTSELRKRNTPNHVPEEESVWTLNVRTSFFFGRLSDIVIDRLWSQPTIHEPLTPTLAAPQARSPLTPTARSMTTTSHTSTPSTIESSLLNSTFPSPPLVAPSPYRNVLPRTLTPDSTASPRDPLADSVLSDAVHKTLFSAHSSPIQSPVRISPRGLQVNLAPTFGIGEDQYAHPLSQGREPSTHSPRSPFASTTYESFTGTQATLLPSLPPSAAQSPGAPPSQFAIYSPLSDSLSLVEHPTAPASTTSWSDIGSAGAEGDRDEMLLGSDAESWARARNVRGR